MKVFGTELKLEAFRSLMEVLGQGAYVAKNSPAAIIEGELEHAYRAAPVGTFGGGVNEVQREIIATVGLGMPRARAELRAAHRHHCVVLPPFTRKMLPVAHRPASDAR